MKKVTKRLWLSKETLRAMQDDRLVEVAAAGLSKFTNCSACPSCPVITCEGYTC